MSFLGFTPLIVGMLFVTDLGYGEDLALEVRAPQIPLRAWTVQDSVAVRYFVTNYGEPQNVFAESIEDDGGRGIENPIVVSAGGERFFFLTFRGDRARDCVENELSVYSTAAIRRELSASKEATRQLQPLASVKMCSGWQHVSRPGIGDAQWIDEDTIQFLGTEGHDESGVFRLTVSSGKLKRFTDPQHRVQPAFDTAAESTVYWNVERHSLPPFFEYPYVRVTLDNVWTPYNPQWTYSRRLYASCHGDGARSIATAKSLFANRNIRISPDGRWAITLFEPDGPEMPAAWREYNNWSGALGGTLRYMLADICGGSVRALFDAPWGHVAMPKNLPLSGANVFREVLWSADSTHVVVVNTALPLDENVQERRQTPYIVDYQLGSGKWRIVEPMLHWSGRGDVQQRVTEVGWVVPGVEFLVMHKTMKGVRSAGTLYRFDRGRWVGHQAPATMNMPAQQNLTFSERRAPTLAHGLKITLRQSANDPPVLAASNKKLEIPLTGPDPALQGLNWTSMRNVEWIDPNGRIAHGELFLPRVAPGSHPPLVIQPYYYAPNVFQPDGNFSTGQAAQAMAAQGIAVLYMDIPLINILKGDLTTVQADTEEELQYFVARIDAAVKALADLRLIDASRVGLIGFSRAGFCTLYALTHPGRTRISAAIILDSMTGSWGEYVENPSSPSSDSPDSQNQYEHFWGNRGSFWRNKEGFLKGSPIFNVDRVQAAVLFQYIGNVPLAPEFLGAFEHNRRPAEWLDFGPEAYHWLQTPRQRIESMTASVDWMNFWLLGVENPDAGRAERNARWREMRVEWQNTQAEEARAGSSDSAQISGKVKP